MLVGGSGHLASYAPLRDSFRVIRVEELTPGCTRFHFVVAAYRESEFVVRSDDAEPEAERLSGSIVLDSAFGLMRDGRGRVMLEPWSCLDPDSREHGAPEAGWLEERSEESGHSGQKP